MKEDLLILHGALGASNQFEALSEMLASQFKVQLVNFEGHGGRPSHRKFSMAHFSENLVAFIEEHSLGPIRIFGYSMGGYVALNTAIQRPDLIKSIVSLGTKFHWTSESAKHEVKFLNPENILNKVPQYAQMLEKRHFPNDWKVVLKKTSDMMLALGNDKALKKEDFARVSVPVKIMVGELDKMVSLEESEQVSDWIPNSKFKILKNTPHPVEKADLKLIRSEIFKF